MKKLCLGGFWFGQYLFGVAAIVAMQKNIPLLPIFLLVASYYSTIIAGKVLGIGQELQQQANGQVPQFLEGLWKIACILVIVLLALNMAQLNEFGGFKIPLTSVHALIIFYVTAAFRDVFLIRFYFSQDFSRA